MNSKNFILMFFVFLVGLTPLDAQLVADSYADAKLTKKATFQYVYDGVPGFIYKEGDQVKGLLVDIMARFESYVKDKEGITITANYEQVPNKDFKIFMSQVKDGKGGVFGLSNVSITPERKKNYLFSPTYLNNVTVLITKSSCPTLTDIASISTQFAGKKAYTVSSSTYYQRLEQIKQDYFPSLEIVSLPSVDEVMAEVVKTEEAFAVIDLLYYLTSVKEEVPIKRHPVGDEGNDKFGVIMPLSNDWEPLMRDFFDSGFVGGSEYKMIITKHLGKGALRLLENAN